MFRNELGSITRLTLLVGSLGVGVGLVALWYWTNLIGYAFVIPVLWIVAALMVTLGIGLVIGIAVARWSSSRPPMTVLRGEL